MNSAPVTISDIEYSLRFLLSDRLFYLFNSSGKCVSMTFLICDRMIFPFSAAGVFLLGSLNIKTHQVKYKYTFYIFEYQINNMYICINVKHHKSLYPLMAKKKK